MQLLIDKELNSNDKILKPDFNSRTGRELLAFYLQTKFKQIIAYDKRCEAPIFKEINPFFIQRFSKRPITNPHKRILIGITGESASGKSTICRELKNLIEHDMFIKEENVSEGAIRKSLNQSIYQLRRMMYLYLR